MKNTAIFLADTWTKIESVVYKTYEISAKQSPAAAIEYLMNNYPVIQGTGNQMRLKTLGSLACNTSEIHGELHDCLSVLQRPNPEASSAGVSPSDA